MKTCGKPTCRCASDPDLVATTGLSFLAAAAAIDALVGLGVAREFGGRCRDRLFVYERCVCIVGEGAEAAIDRCVEVMAKGVRGSLPSAQDLPFELLDLGPLGCLGEGGGRLVAEGRVVESAALGVEGLGERVDGRVLDQQ